MTMPNFISSLPSQPLFFWPFLAGLMFDLHRTSTSLPLFVCLHHAHIVIKVTVSERECEVLVTIESQYESRDEGRILEKKETRW